eukprot:1077969-Rhodomonas_salina.1
MHQLCVLPSLPAPHAQADACTARSSEPSRMQQVDASSSAERVLTARARVPECTEMHMNQSHATL